VIKPRDEDGKVITEPRNFFTTRMKRGQSDKVLFSKPGYNALGDPYRGMTADATKRTTVKDGFRKAGHDLDFKPAKMIH
jgi:hypothetical protein